MLKARNPFSNIWKVMKYDFQYSARTFLPVYAVLLVLAVLRGLFSKSLVNVNISEGSYQAYSQSTSLASFGLGLLFFAFYAVAIVITIVILTRRFKVSMFGDEAYLNLSLPVTMGEHLWGHFLLDMLWIIVCNLVTIAAFFLAFHKDLRSEWFIDIYRELVNNVMVDSEGNQIKIRAGIVILSILSMLVANSLYITFVFFINSFGHLFGRNKIPAKIAAIILTMVIYSKLGKLITPHIEFSSGSVLLIYAILYNLFFSVVFFATSWSVLKYKLNLE